MRAVRRAISLFNYLHNLFTLHKQKICIGTCWEINGRINIISKGVINIGDKFRVNSGANYNIIGGDIRTNLITYKDGKIEIGNNVGISNTTIVAHCSVRIEDDVRIGGGCKIYDSDFHSLKYEERMMTPDPGIECKPVEILNGAFIGAHSIILKGVVIGRHSVVGAGSVVAKNIPDNEVWGGNPAKFIKKLGQENENFMDN